MGAPKGAHAISRCFAEAPERSPTPVAVESSRCTVEVYALSEAEAIPLKTSGISSGEYTVVVGKSTPKAEVRSTSTIGPGQSGSVGLTSDSPLKVHFGQRCVIVTDDHIAAAGVITSVEP